MLSLAPFGRRRLLSRLQEAEQGAEQEAVHSEPTEGRRGTGEGSTRQEAEQEAEQGGCTPSRPKGGEERGAGLLTGYTAPRRHELPTESPHSPNGCTPSRP